MFLVLFKNVVDPLSFQCESCLLAKSQRKPYIPKPYYVSKPFYFFHSDNWGPSKVNTISRKKMVCDFYRRSHSSLVGIFNEGKYEIERIFKEIFKLIESQFRTKISILRSDKGIEYFNKVLETFLNEKGILHQSTCSDTHK